MTDNNKNCAAAVGIALFLVVAALGFSIAAMQSDDGLGLNGPGRWVQEEVEDPIIEEPDPDFKPAEGSDDPKDTNPNDDANPGPIDIRI
jgi:hypothetical protein